jgi:sulfur carrier protein ThiS
MSTFFSKVVRVPGAVVEVALNEGATVADALEAANITLAPNEAVAVNGANVELSRVITSGEVISVAKSAKSGS